MNFLSIVLEIKCPAGQEYNDCGPETDHTCTSAKLIFNQNECHEGCYCIGNTVLYNGKCIPKDLCPCTYGTSDFPLGSTIKQNCKYCECVSGEWACPNIECGARCEIIHGIHHSTFDKKKFNFQSDCSYYLIRSPNLIVTEQTINDNQNIEIKLYSGKAEFKVFLKTRTNVKVNDHEIPILPKSFLNGTLIIRQLSSSMKLVELIEEGVKIWFDDYNSRVMIDVPANYRRKTRGLCGTFTDKVQDDFLTLEGDIEQNVSPFVNKWRVDETCEELDEYIHNASPCQLNAEYETDAHDICSDLIKVFYEGHKVVHYNEYHEDCMYNVCLRKKLNTSESACSVFASYADEIARHDVVVNWRQQIPSCCKYL